VAVVHRSLVFAMSWPQAEAVEFMSVRLCSTSDPSLVEVGTLRSQLFEGVGREAPSLSLQRPVVNIGIGRMPSRRVSLTKPAFE